MFKTMGRIIRWTGEYKKRLYLGFLWSFLQTMFTAVPIMGAGYFLNRKFWIAGANGSSHRFLHCGHCSSWLSPFWGVSCFRI